MISTKVKAKCVAKNTSQSYNEKNPVTTVIGLEVPYDPNSIYHKLSGGTNLELRTINQEAADMFVLGKDYDIVISPSVEE